MKTLIFYLVLTLVAGITQAQEITELKEARVGFSPLISELSPDGQKFSYKVNESYSGEFEKDPLLFMSNHFDINDLIAQVKGEKFNSYLVSFRSSKGDLLADFDAQGKLIRSSSKLKNIRLPKELSHQLYQDHKGWTMVKNVHIVRGWDGMVSQNLYKIKLVNGKERKSIVLEAPQKGMQIASK